MYDILRCTAQVMRDIKNNFTLDYIMYYQFAIQ